ncbi:LemA family protein [Luteococcus japonicus]|uniref:LemA protein n=1 Tax=Luteococcus japonicus LSP_Lj1 TaxID=1255658 RepID=A0A1R4I803_9ACTN|nr:LemA family protein [Luteococcus japonicus]SJN15879.1 LemA protein [Luteococcus japonicus LSP_Lj1]
MWTILFILLGLLVLAGILFIAPYNGFVRQRNVIQESWRQVDVELNRRYELLPNLVETVRAYAGHERNTLEEITKLRSQAMALSQGGAAEADPERANVEAQLSGAVRNMMVSVEAYPELRSNQNFLELQRQLAETEDRIAAGRRFYNANVRAYNTKVESVPSNIVANMFHFEKATYFEVNDAAVRQAPDVNFGEISYRGDAPQQHAPGVNQAASVTSNELPNPQAQAPQAQQAWQPEQQAQPRPRDGQ